MSDGEWLMIAIGMLIFMLVITFAAARFISHRLKMSFFIAFLIFYFIPPLGFLLLLVALFEHPHPHSQYMYV